MELQYQQQLPPVLIKKKDKINNNINLQKNNLKKLNKIKKREALPNFLNLSVSKIKQLSAQWCGPAIGESILRYFGLNTDIILNNVNINHQRTYTSFQHYLAYLMQTITNQNLNPDLTPTNSRYTYLGTLVDNWTNQINNFISSEYLNNNRQYSLTTINRNHNIGNIVSLIRNSLQNNTPVALAYRGYLPELFSENSNQIENHFIIIRGIRGVLSPSGTNITIDYMDPGTGQYGSFSGLVLRLLISNSDDSGRALESFLISHIPSTISTESQISRPNQTESMEMGSHNVWIQPNIHFENCFSVSNCIKNNLQSVEEGTSNTYNDIINIGNGANMLDSHYVFDTDQKIINRFLDKNNYPRELNKYIKLTKDYSINPSNKISIVNGDKNYIVLNNVYYYGENLVSANDKIIYE
ncbi:MAG: hypothetical protein OHM57_12450 [Spiroplasma phoeniceum]|nr:MAG: hypothetical protein OHM57_12450 [Spiroplasma phoeniceum]